MSTEDPSGTDATFGASGQLPENLQGLIGQDDANAEEPVPGEDPHRTVSFESPSVDWRAFAQSLRDDAQGQASALSKSRALSVAGLIFSNLEDEQQAEDSLAEATEVSPRLAVSAMLHRRSARLPADPAVRRSSESTMRQASQEDSRTHATLALLRILKRQGDTKEYGALLDRIARSHPSDRAIVLRRLAHRISERQSLAGVDIPASVSEAVLWTHELLLGTDGRGGVFEPSDGFRHRKRLFLLRAARLLHQGNYQDALDCLASAGLEDETLLELRAASYSTRAGDSQRSKELYEKLAQLRPTRSVLRAWALHAASLGDRESLSRVLQDADPAAGTFHLSERALLSALCGNEITLSADERSALAESEPALAFSLGDPTFLALLPEQASDEALLLQLGAHSARLAERPEASRQLADAALTELERREQHPHLVAALRLAQTLISKRGPLTLDAFRRFGEVVGDARIFVLLAFLSERVHGPELALEAYRQALEVEPSFVEARLRALQSLQPAGVRDELQRLTAATKTPWLRLVRALELLVLDRKFAENAASPIDWTDVASACETLVALSPRRDQKGGTLEELGALLDTARQLAICEGQTDVAAQFEGLLLEIPSPHHDLLVFSRSWFDPSDRVPVSRSSMPPRPPEDFDVTQRALARAMGDTAPGARFEAKSSTSEQAAQLVHNMLFGRLDVAISNAKNVLSSASEGSLVETSFLQQIFEDLQRLSGDVEELSSVLLERTKEPHPDETRRLALQGLFDIDEGRNDKASAAMWQRALCEQFPRYLPGLLRMEEIRLTTDGTTGGAALRERIAGELPPVDARTYRMYFGAEALSKGDLFTARQHLLPLLDEENPTQLVVRGLSMVAEDKHDDELAARIDELLFERASTDLDRASAALGVAYCRSRLGKKAEAVSWAKKALMIKADYFSAALLVSALSTTEDPIERAEELEALAGAARAQHRGELWFGAATAWNAAEDSVREAACLEATLEASPQHPAAFARLLFLHRESGDFSGQKSLLIAHLKHLDQQTLPYLELTLELAELLITHGEARAAKEHLEKALVHHPAHAPALRVHADISAKLGEHGSAERSLVALRDRLPGGPDRTAVVRSLARLYSEELGQWERAMDAYQAVLREDPKDRMAKAALVDVYTRLGLGDRAASLQTEIIVDAQTSNEKRAGALKLAKLYEEVAKDDQKAAATLERTRKAWPLDAEVLEASIRFMDRHGGGPRGFILDRASKDARRKLQEDRLSGPLLETLARVALLSGAHAQSEACSMARSAYLGEEHDPLRPAGLAALSEEVEELIAPQGLPRPLRNLFRKTGAAMEAAFAVDLSAFGARRLVRDEKRQSELALRVDKLAAALKLGPVELFVSDSLGARCLTVTTRPARLLIGKAFLELSGRPRDYLLLRAFKMQTMGVGALSRSRPEDRFPMTVALLQLFSPGFVPPKAVDGRKVAQARALIEQGLARVGYDDDVVMLALEAIGALGGQGGELGVAAKRLASRAALIGVGDLAQCLEAIAAGEGKSLSTGGPSRFRFMEGQPEARDLILFSTTSAFSRARTSLGLSDDANRSSRGSLEPPKPSAPSTPGSPSLSPRAPTPPRRLAPPMPPRRERNDSEE